MPNRYQIFQLSKIHFQLTRRWSELGCPSSSIKQEQTYLCHQLGKLGALRPPIKANLAEK
jgi:hypothetical protein